MVYDRTYAGQPAEGFIYVMECASYYKIGYSAYNPRKRQRDIQIGNPLPVTLIGVIEGSLTHEAEWHQFFRDKRVRGEWFALTEEDIAHVLHESIGIDRIPGEFDVA